MTKPSPSKPSNLSLFFIFFLPPGTAVSAGERGYPGTTGKGQNEYVARMKMERE